MPFLIGVDEAGYGPNLGPLVIAATAWRVPQLPSDDLYEQLAEAVTRDATGARATGRVAIADSKQLYQPQRGVADLERGVLAAMRALGLLPPTFHELLAALEGNHRATQSLIPWHEAHNDPLPVAAEVDDCRSAAALLVSAFKQTSISLVAVRAAIVQPERFNDLVDEHDGKGAALSETTLNLVAAILSELSPEPTCIVCDKHGGRNRYGELLHGRFGDALVEVHCESRAASIYRWGPADRRVEICFRAGGEEFLPAALASMAAKYARELSMRAFNAFWQAEIPALRPTAGYPGDAQRFRREIAAVQQRLGISDRVLWRNR